MCVLGQPRRRVNFYLGRWCRSIDVCLDQCHRSIDYFLGQFHRSTYDWVWLKVKCFQSVLIREYFKVFDCILKNALENILKCLVVFLKML